jgi:VanZ family protein
MLRKKKLLTYIIIILTTVIIGLSLRCFARYLPRWINLYVGDFLWAFMIFFIFSMIFKKKSTLKIMVLSLIYCYLIEISQIYHAQWIDNIRQTVVGHLVLGRGFLLSDLISYTIGILAGGFVEFNYLFKK